MSSDLKDARWQLAEEMAVEDGVDLYNMLDGTREIYLTVAQQRLSVADSDTITDLATKFRKDIDGD